MIETARLTLRRWRPDDFEAYAAMCADDETMRFVTQQHRALTRGEAWRSFAGVLGHWEIRGYGMFAVFERASGELVGRIGPWQPEGWPGFEIGWTLTRASWGKGFATEAVRACIAYAFDALAQPHVISLIDPANTRSIAVAARVGERLEGEQVMPGEPEYRVLRYGIAKS